MKAKAKTPMPTPKTQRAAAKSPAKSAPKRAKAAVATRQVLPEAKLRTSGVKPRGDGAAKSVRAPSPALGKKSTAQPRKPVSKAPTKSAKAAKTPLPSKLRKASVGAKSVGAQTAKAAAAKSRAPTVEKKAKAKPTPESSRKPAKAASVSPKKSPPPVSPVKPPISKPAVKPQVKPSGKTASVKTANSKAPVVKTTASNATSSAATPKSAKPAVATTAPSVVSASGAVLRQTAPLSSRAAARLAALSVPSMAQAVASTAAKASFSKPTPAQVFSPMPSAPVKKDAKRANNWKTKPVHELVDPDILAMPDSEYMNDTQMSFFRIKLTALKQEILNSAGQTTEHLREDTVVVPDPADRATIEEEHALELRTRDRERKLLKKIEQSLTRIDAGDYGYCDETGEPIGVGRLLARPTATLSLEAQQRRELKQKMFGD